MYGTHLEQMNLWQTTNLWQTMNDVGDGGHFVSFCSTLGHEETRQGTRPNLSPRDTLSIW